MLHKYFIFTIFLFVGFGLVIMASASGHQSQVTFGNSLYLFTRQFFYGFLLGLAGFLAAYSVRPSWVKKIAVIFLFVSIFLLVAVLFPGIGIEHGGARRWLSIGGVSFQPSETAKLALILYSASWLASRRREIQDLRKGFIPFLTLSIPIPFLILLEPNISNFGISMMIIFILLFAARARVSHLTGLGVLIIFIAALSIFIFPKRMERVSTFLNPRIDPKGLSYQINQSLIAIGSGGLTGKGLGESTAKKGYLPEPSGDAIFAVLGEETGFLGASFLVFFYLLLLGQGLIIAIRSHDFFSRYVIVGFVSLISLQAFINISAVSGLVPLTGVTLPFISYGSTSLVTFLTASGLVARMAKEI